MLIENRRPINNGRSSRKHQFGYACFAPYSFVVSKFDIQEKGFGKIRESIRCADYSLQTVWKYNASDPWKIPRIIQNTIG